VERLNVNGELIGISRSHRYYKHKQPLKDWKTKQLIEKTLHDHRSYGHKRLAKHLHINKKRILRVMKIYGIKPYRRTTKKSFVYKKKGSVIPNLLITEVPQRKGDIYASDFTYIKYKGKWIYVATVIDLYTREIVGLSVLNTHTTQLVVNALGSAVLHHPPPRIIHSDGGSEYTSKDYGSLLSKLRIQQSMSRPACPWENGYQESFYKGFKIDLGDPNRFDSLGELVAEIYETINYYNHHRIHTALGMPPAKFAQKNIIIYDVNSLEKVS
jgi:putative transposase